VLATSPDVKVVILTTFEQDDYIFDALSAGASGFLLKRTRPRSSSRRFIPSRQAILCSRLRSPARSSSAWLTSPFPTAARPRDSTR